MAASLVLAGLLLLMLCYIRIVGEVLKQDVVLGYVALLTFPIFSFYWVFFKDYKKCIKHFIIGVLGAILVIIGKSVGGI